MQIKPDSLISSVLPISLTMVLQFLLELWNSPARMFKNVASSFMELCNSTAINTLECEQSHYKRHVWIFQDTLWSPKPPPLAKAGLTQSTGLHLQDSCERCWPRAGCRHLPGTSPARLLSHLVAALPSHKVIFFPRVLVKQAKAWCIT